MYIKVRVRTGARAESVRIVADDRLDISVRERAERGEANTRVVELVARHFRLPAASVRITKGHHRPSKILLVRKEPGARQR